MAGRTASVVFLGNDAQLNATLARIEGKLKAVSGVAEEQNAKMAASSEAAGAKIGRAYDEGTTKAASGLRKLSALGGSFGVPLTGSLDAVGKHLDDTHAKTGKLHDALAALGKVTLVGGLAGLGVASAESVKMAESFQSATASIAANSDITQKAADKIGSAFLNTAGQSIFSGQQMSSAFAAVAGQLKLTEGHALGVADATKVMAAASDLAEGTHEALGASTAALSTVMQAYHLSVGQAAGASDMLFNVSRAMNVPLNAVAQGVNKLHGRLGELAPTLADTSALMIELGQHGITGTRGVTVVNTALQTLVGGSKNVTAVLRALGVEIFDQNGKFIGLQGVIAQLEPKLAGLTQKQQLFAEKTLFGAGAAQVMGQVVQAGVGKFQQATAAAQKMGTAHQAAADQSKTLHNQIETLKATVVDLGTKFGLFLIPKLQATGSAIKDVIVWMGKHKTAAEVLAGTITGVLGLAITVFAYTKAVAFVGATKDMLGGIGKLASGIASVVPTILTKLGLIGTTATATATEAGAADSAIDAANVTAGASFTAMGAEATAGAAEVESGVAAMAAATATADSAIETANVAAGLSFTAMLGPIGAVAAAAGGLLYLGSQSGPGPVGGGFGNPVLGTGRPANAGLIGTPGADGTLNVPGAGALGAGKLQQLLNGASTSGGVPVPTTGSNWQKIAGALSAQGFSKVAIAGILGNFAQETGGGNLNSINTNDSGTGASGMGGMGIAQWTGGRRTAEMQYAAAHHLPSTAIQAQVGFLVHELRTNYHGAFAPIQNASSPAAAAAWFNKYFEGGTDPHGVRERAAQQAYGLLGGGGGGGGLKIPTAPSGLSNSQLAALLNGSGSTSASTSAGPKATMRYVNHHPVGAMTDAQWQAYQAAHPATTRSLLYANPLAGDTYTTERTDQGKDFGGIHGNLVAVGAGVITLARSLQGFGQTIVEKLTSGPNKGQSIYYGLETGAVPVGLRQGQHVSAGQAVARGLGGGGLELGFWDPATGHALGNQGFNGSNATPGGTAFVRFLQQIGARGLFTTTNNSTGVVTGGGQSVGPTLAQLEQALAQSIQKAATSLLTRYGNIQQSGTLRTLSSALGVDTGAGNMAHVLGSTIQALGPAASIAEINATTGPHVSTALETLSGHEWNELAKDLGLNPKHSPSLAAFQDIIGGLTGKQVGGLEKHLGHSRGRDLRNLGTALHAAHGPGRSLTSALNAAVAGSPQEKQYEQTVANLIATGQKDLAAKLVAAHKATMATLAQEVYAEQTAKDAETLQLTATQLKDQTTAIANAAQDQLDVTKAGYQLQNDAAQSQLTAVRDMTQTITDQFSGMVTAVQDAATQMTDSTNAVVTGINDQTQVQVDVLGEKGLYGLNLVAQKQQVTLDQQKASDDQQIALAQMNLDQVTGQWHVAVSSAQVGLDQLTTQQDQLSAQAQQAADTVAIAQAIRIQTAQAQVDALTLHEDTAVIGPAQIAVDLGAVLPKAQQDVLGAQLRKAQGQAGVAEGGRGVGGALWFQGIQNSVNLANADAQQAATTAGNTAQQMIGAANQTLQTVTGQANYYIALAAAGLSGAQGAASLAEAPLSAAQKVTAATASTQFAGTGTSIQIFGIPTENAAAIGAAVDWVARTQLQVPA